MAAHQAPIPGILQARILEWVAISFSSAWKWKVKVKSLSHVRLCSTPRSKTSFNFAAAVTVHSDFGSQENKICHCFHFSPSICHEVMGPESAEKQWLCLQHVRKGFLEDAKFSWTLKIQMNRNGEQSKGHIQSVREHGIWQVAQQPLLDHCMWWRKKEAKGKLQRKAEANEEGTYPPG